MITPRSYCGRVEIVAFPSDFLVDFFFSPAFLAVLDILPPSNISETSRVESSNSPKSVLLLRPEM